MAVHPAAPLLLGALLLFLLRGRFQRFIILGSTIWSLGAGLRVENAPRWTHVFLGGQLELLRVDALSQLFGLVFVLITVLACVYALHVKRWTEHAAALSYAAGSLGVVFAGDWITMFVFWEIMSVTSFFLIWLDGRAVSRGAGFRYLLVHALGGGLLLAGILLHVHANGSLLFEALPSHTGWSFWLILAGFSINAAIPPLHAWLTDAYPEATVTGSVFLSVFTTKTAIYVLLRAVPGAEVLVVLGVAMALYGVVFAVLENDIRRLLAYHIISQVGYMVAGVGMGTALALNGAASHAFCHILYKALLFMGAGAVIYMTGKRKLTELGGIARAVPWTFFFYMVGAVSISGFPLFNGFVSKSMVIGAAGADGRPITELLLMLASIGTFLHTGLKLPYFTFLDRDRGLTASLVPLPKNMLWAMAGAALMCFGIGVFPGWLYAMLPHSTDYHPYTTGHVVGSLQLLLGTGIAFWILLRKLGGEATVTLDTDWMYRKPLFGLGTFVVRVVAGAGRILRGLGETGARWGAAWARNPFALLDPYGTYDENRYRFSISLTIFWVMMGFAAAGLYLLF